MVTDSHSPLSHLTQWALTGLAAPSSHVLAGWSELYSLIKTCTEGWYTISIVLSVTPLCMPAVRRIISAGRIPCQENYMQGEIKCLLSVIILENTILRCWHKQRINDPKFQKQIIFSFFNICYSCCNSSSMLHFMW